MMGGGRDGQHWVPSQVQDLHLPESPFRKCLQLSFLGDQRKKSPQVSPPLQRPLTAGRGAQAAGHPPKIPALVFNELFSWDFTRGQAGAIRSQQKHPDGAVNRYGSRSSAAPPCLGSAQSLGMRGGHGDRGHRTLSSLGAVKAYPIIRLGNTFKSWDKVCLIAEAGLAETLRTQ